MTVYEFQEKYPTKEEREEAAREMSAEELEELIASCNTIQAKIYYSRLLTE